MTSPTKVRVNRSLIGNSVKRTALLNRADSNRDFDPSPENSFSQTDGGYEQDTLRVQKKNQTQMSKVKTGSMISLVDPPNLEKMYDKSGEEEFKDLLSDDL